LGGDCRRDYCCGGVLFGEDWLGTCQHPGCAVFAYPAFNVGNKARNDLISLEFIRLSGCFYADSFYRTAIDAIFTKITDATTPKQFQAAQESLKLLWQELEQDMPPMHFASRVGTHRCVKDMYREASARLRSLAIMQPVPLPPVSEPEAPTQTTLTREDVLRGFEREFPPQTLFGDDQDEDDAQ
jgi:hypothetical protein